MMKAAEMMRGQRGWLIVILAASAAARVGVALWMGNAVDTLPGIYDQVSYHALALRLLEGHGFTFAENWWPLTRAGEPTAHWSYLYTLWLAASYAITGAQPLAPRLAQAVAAGLLMPWLTYRLAARTLGTGTRAGRLGALLAAAWTAGYGYFVYYGAALMTETFYFVGILWTLDCALRLGDQRDGPRVRLWVELGLAIGITALLRQVFLVFVPVLFVWLWLAALRVPDPRGQDRGAALGRAAGTPWAALRRWVAGAIVSGLAAAVLVLPFTAYNWARFGQFVLLNTNAGYAFFWANHPIYEDRFVAVLTSPSYVDLVPPELRELNEAALDSALLRRGMQFVFDDPVRYLRLSVSRVPVFFMFWPTSESSALSNVVRGLSFGTALPFMLAGLASWAAGRAWRRGPGGLLALFIVVYSGTHLLSWSLIRYRLPVDAVALVFAGGSLAALLLWARDRLRRAAPPE